MSEEVIKENPFANGWKVKSTETQQIGTISDEEEVRTEEKPEEVKSEEVKTEEIKSEAPPAEKQEEVKAEEAPKEVASEEVEKENKPVVDTKELEKLRFELSEREKAIADLEAKYNSKEPEFANEEIKKLNELAKGGTKLNNEFWMMQSLELDSFDTSNKKDALELKRLELKVSNPELTDTEVDRLVRRNYKPLFDDTLDADDEEFKEALIDLSIDAKKARTMLAEHKSKIQLPKVDIKAQEEEARLEREANQKFLIDVKTQVSNYKEQPYKIGDSELTFNIDDDSRKAVESAIVNNQSFFVDTYVKDGVVNYEALKKDMLLLANQDRIFKMIKDQGISEGKASVVDELENADTTVETGATESRKSVKESWSLADIAKNRK